MGDATAGVKENQLGAASQPAEFAVFEQEADALGVAGYVLGWGELELAAA